MENYRNMVENTQDYLKNESQMIVNLMEADQKPDKAELPTHLRMVYGHVDWESLIFRLDKDIIKLLTKNEDSICVGLETLGRLKEGDHVAILNSDTLGPVTYKEMVTNSVEIELLDFDEAINLAAKWYVDDLLESVYSFSLFTPYFLLAFRLALMEGDMPGENRFAVSRLQEVWRKTYSSVMYYVGDKLQQEAIAICKSDWRVTFNLEDYQVERYFDAREI